MKVHHFIHSPEELLKQRQEVVKQATEPKFLHRVTMVNLILSGMKPKDLSQYRNKKRGTGVPPIANTLCNSCGTCAAECPVQAIPLDAPNTTTEACIGCMRCISVCPQKAREIPSSIRQWLTEYLQGKASEAKQADIFLESARERKEISHETSSHHRGHFCPA